MEKEQAQSLLEGMAANFCQRKLEENRLKKQNGVESDTIKQAMALLSLRSFVSNGYQLSYSTSDKVVFNEDNLIDTLKRLNIPGAALKKIVKKREYVDFEALEEAIYKDIVDAATLVDCQESSESSTLRVKKLKE